MTYSSTILSDTPQAYYRMAESSGLIAHDSSGNGYDATLPSSGITYSQTGAIVGDTDTALLFGGGTTITLPSTLNIATWTALSLEYWINITSGYQYIVVTTDGTTTITYLNGVVYTSGSGDVVVVDSDLTYSGSVASGDLDEIALYNYVLTPAQISRHYYQRLSSGGFALFANTASGTATFDSFRVSQYPDPALNLSTVGRVASSLTQWTATTPTNTALTVKTSTDGVNFTAATNGGVVPGFYLQPLPQIDVFTSNTSTSYSSTYRTGGGVATWTYDTTNSRIVATGGTNGIYVYNAISRSDVDLLCTLDRADAGGLVWRFMDQNNFYYLQIADGSSSNSTPNTLTLYKVVANVQTTLATASITFPRGTRVVLAHVVMAGGVITVYFDSDQTVLTYTDGSPLGAGLMGLYNNGGATGSRYYQLRLQPLGDNLAGEYLYTEEDLSTTDPSVSPLVLDTLVSVRGPGIADGAIIPALHDPTKPFAVNYNTDFDSLVQASANATADYFWDVDKNGVLTFTNRLATPAPWCLNDADLLFTPTVTPTFAADLYKNQYTVTNCTGLVTVTNEQKIADGTATSWTMAYPLYSAPTVTVGGVVKKVGIQGVDTGKDFYWQAGSSSVSQDASATTIPSGTILQFAPYVGQFVQNVTANNLPEQVARRAIETGTSGIVAAWEDGKGMLATNAATYASGVLARYSNNSAVQVVATTEKLGLRPGMMISAFLPEFFLNNTQLLIVRMITTGYQNASGGVQYRYQITATNGPSLSNWASVFGK